MLAATHINEPKYLHRRYRGLWTGGSWEHGEWRLGTGLFNVRVRKASRQHSMAGEDLRGRDEFRAIDHLVLVISEQGELQHYFLEPKQDLGLIICSDG